MSVTASELRKLASLNLSSEQMAGVLDMLACRIDADEARKASQADRTAKYRRRGGSAIPDDMRQRIFERDEYKCQDCGAVDNLSIDHITPVSKGGATEDENLEVLCIPCNSRKRDRDRKRNVRGMSAESNGIDASNIGFCDYPSG